MGRFSPTVLPRGFELGSALDEAGQGFLRGRSIKADKRRQQREDEIWQEHLDDRNRQLAALRAADLSKPGALTLSDFLDESLAAGRQPLTDETLNRVANAGDENVPIDFRRPAPVTVRVPGATDDRLQAASQILAGTRTSALRTTPGAPGGSTFQMPARTPYLTGSGIVIDPQAAMREASLTRALDEAEKLRFAGEQARAEHPERFYTPDELEARARAEHPERWGMAHWYGNRPGGGAAGAKPVVPLSQVNEVIDELYGTWDPNSGAYVFPPELQDPSARRALAREMLGPGVTIPEPPPAAPLPVAPSVEAGPPRPNIFQRIGTALRSAAPPMELQEDADQRAIETGAAAPPARRTAAPARTAPTGSAASAPGPGPASKRVITQDQAEYLRAIGKWDPNRYEIR